MTVEPCNNTSVGILVWDLSGQLLLIERRKYPFGFAPPAGHVDPGEDYPAAAARELREEVGLTASELRLVLRNHRRDNQCRRPGGAYHQWAVYATATSQEPVRSMDETSSMRWVNVPALQQLADRTQAYLAGGIPEDEWQAAPGLEPVWLDMLTDLGWIGGGR